MNNSSDNKLIILTNIIKARCCIENELIFLKEYLDLPTEGNWITNVPYYEVKNIGFRTVMKSGSIVVTLECNLVFVYECFNLSEGMKSHRLLTQKVEKTFNVDKSMFAPFSDFSDKIRCHCKLKNINCLYDTDISCSKISITVHADLECFLLEEEEIQLDNSEKVIQSLNAQLLKYEEEIEFLKTTNGNLNSRLRELEEKTIASAAAIAEEEKKLLL